MAARQKANLVEARAVLAKSRPTAVNLAWALERVGKSVDWEEEAVAIHQEDVRLCQRLGKAGASLLNGGVLTICNTGALATGGHGTALGMVRSALTEGRSVHLYALETRPYNQGSRLTTWECSREGIPCTLLADSMAGALLASGRVSTVVAGADRVANNGDTANKIGTYSLAVLAKHHKVPFYIAMPMSTLDRQCPDGGHIPIEERPGEELFPAQLAGVQVSRGQGGWWRQDQLVAVTRCGILRLTSPPPTLSPGGSVKRGSGPRTTSGCRRLSLYGKLFQYGCFK